MIWSVCRKYIKYFAQQWVINHSLLSTLHVPIPLQTKHPTIFLSYFPKTNYALFSHFQTKKGRGSQAAAVQFENCPLWEESTLMCNKTEELHILTHGVPGHFEWAGQGIAEGICTSNLLPLWKISLFRDGKSQPFLLSWLSRHLHRCQSVVSDVNGDCVGHKCRISSCIFIYVWDLLFSRLCHISDTYLRIRICFLNHRFYL